MRLTGLTFPPKKTIARLQVFNTPHDSSNQATSHSHIGLILCTVDQLLHKVSGLRTGEQYLFRRGKISPGKVQSRVGG